MALLHLAAAQRADLHVLHVDHQLRRSSHVDAAYVAGQASKLGLPWSVLKVNVDHVARRSPEDDARRVRYAALTRAGAALGLDWIATAHTADDQAETALLRAVRGAGLAGIPSSNGLVVRPLLDRTRAQLRDVLSERGISWIEDPSNTDTRFERNWVRHVLLPLVRERRPGADAALAAAARIAREDEDYLREQARLLLGDTGSTTFGIVVPDAPTSIRRRAVQMALVRLGVDPSRSRVERLLNGEDAEPVAVLAESAGMRLVSTMPIASARLDAGDVTAFGLRVRVNSSRGWWRCTLDAPAARVTLRARRPGDRIGTATVADLLAGARIPRPLRDRVPVVAVDDEAVAVVAVTGAGDRGATTVDVDPVEEWWRSRLARVVHDDQHRPVRIERHRDAPAFRPPADIRLDLEGPHRCRHLHRKPRLA
jgi:tRNA(Ile)-lysidine synthase